MRLTDRIASLEARQNLENYHPELALHLRQTWEEQLATLAEYERIEALQKDYWAGRITGDEYRQLM